MIKIFVPDNSVQFLNPFLFHILLPVFIHHGMDIKRSDKLIDEVFFVAEFNTGVDGLVDVDTQFAVFDLVFMVLFNMPQNIINIDLNLIDEFHFKHKVIVDIFLFAATCFAKLVIKVNVFAVIILNIPLG